MIGDTEKDPPFTAGDRVMAIREGTMVPAGDLVVKQVEPMRGFQSGWGVKVEWPKRIPFLCASLFEIVRRKPQPTAQERRQPWDPNDTRF